MFSQLQRNTHFSAIPSFKVTSKGLQRNFLLKTLETVGGSKEIQLELPEVLWHFQETLNFVFPTKGLRGDYVDTVYIIYTSGKIFGLYCSLQEHNGLQEDLINFSEI